MIIDSNKLLSDYFPHVSKEYVMWAKLTYNIDITKVYILLEPQANSSSNTMAILVYDSKVVSFVKDYVPGFVDVDGEWDFFLKEYKLLDFEQQSILNGNNIFQVKVSSIIKNNIINQTNTVCYFPYLDEITNTFYTIINKVDVSLFTPVPFRYVHKTGPLLTNTIT